MQDASDLPSSGALAAPQSAKRRGGTERVGFRAPDFASGRFELTDEWSGHQLGISIVGAHGSPGERVENMRIYRDVLPGADLFVRARTKGVEDYLVFEQAPAKTELRYHLALSSTVAGLRLVENTLEIIDGNGTPTLQMAPPFLIDMQQHLTWAQLRIDGCAVDTDPSGPWDHKPTPPGASSCDLVVTWKKSGTPGAHYL